MPELPEVETVRRGLADRLSSFQIQAIEVLRDRAVASPGGVPAFTNALTGSWVGAWHRRGKYLYANLLDRSTGATDDRGIWGVHLRMTGQFLWLEEESAPCHHTRVRMWNSKGEELRFVDVRSFGQMWWVPPGEAPESVMTGLQRLGPEPFDPQFSGHYLRERLKGSKRSIKAALLDQSLVAGAGNIYADESLFAAGIAPQTVAGTLTTSRLDTLCHCLVDVLERSIGVGGTTFSDFRDLEGVNGNYGGMALVYRRTGKPCQSCGAPIERTRITGRSTHWCPSCQT